MGMHDVTNPRSAPGLFANRGLSVRLVTSSAAAVGFVAICRSAAQATGRQRCPSAVPAVPAVPAMPARQNGTGDPGLTRDAPAGGTGL